MTEPTRPMPNPQPQPDGSWQGTIALTPKSIKTRALFTLPPNHVIPVIVVPGTMGSNLRMKPSLTPAQSAPLQPGEPAWRPPNGDVAGYMSGGEWDEFTPAQRQQILDPAKLEVDGAGEIDLQSFACLDGIHEAQARERGWGEVHWDSYGTLLYTLEHNLNSTFKQFMGAPELQPHWAAVNRRDRASWNWTVPVTGLLAPLTMAELRAYAKHHFPVYASGYNWLASCGDAAALLAKHVEEIIAFWSSRKQVCTQAILVTHSMGGLVARACAKQIPGAVMGIVHGVMPALGAPVCYRRIACGTETSRPGAGMVAKTTMGVVAKIVGETSEATTAVMATAPGVLELLPTHLYPGTWLHVVSRKSGDADNGYNRDKDQRDNQHLHLPEGNPYDLYRDTTSWYRLIDPGLADPAGKYAGSPASVEKAIKRSIDQAEQFHRILDTFYHKNSYAFYGNDPSLRSHGELRWRSLHSLGSLSPYAVKAGKPVSLTSPGGRNVEYPGAGVAYFEPMEQDASGDGTVPAVSGAGPVGHIKQVFATRGYDHQGCYNDEAMLDLTQHLIARIVLGAK